MTIKNSLRSINLSLLIICFKQVNFILNNNFQQSYNSKIEWTLFLI
jgi:hypothetical protein